ncbi:MAG: hypothetical protein JWO89_3185 [Verrucomicrobiaceae bacterium]|nr:hypothetical protein [Verrucomicrobiaceae bacterium]
MSSPVAPQLVVLCVAAVSVIDLALPSCGATRLLGRWAARDSNPKSQSHELRLFWDWDLGLALVWRASSPVAPQLGMAGGWIGIGTFRALQLRRNWAARCHSKQDALIECPCAGRVLCVQEMKVFHYSTDQPTGAGQGSRPPFGMQFQSKSPLLGCLLLLGLVVVGVLLAVGASVFLLIAPVGLLLWRAVQAFLPAPAQSDVPEQHYPSTPGVIDVEATVLPPALEGDRQRGDWEN